jgi:signal transduction histidine kinase
MSAEDAVVRVRVVDTGEGIDADNIPKILGRFYTLRDPKDRSRTGLGLSIVQRIMNLHGQTVSVLSQRGVGTTIEITLERAPSASVPSLARTA